MIGYRLHDAEGRELPECLGPLRNDLPNYLLGLFNIEPDPYRDVILFRCKLCHCTVLTVASTALRYTYDGNGTLGIADRLRIHLHSCQGLEP